MGRVTIGLEQMGLVVELITACLLVVPMDMDWEVIVLAELVTAWLIVEGAAAANKSASAFLRDWYSAARFLSLRIRLWLFCLLTGWKLGGCWRFEGWTGWWC